MEAKRLDSLFKKALRNHAAEPSPEAWSKMEAILEKKRSPYLWMRYAAACLVLLVSSVVYWSHSDHSKEEPFALQAIASLKPTTGVSYELDDPVVPVRVQLQNANISQTSLTNLANEMDVERESLSVVAEEETNDILPDTEIIPEKEVKVIHIASQEVKLKKKPIRITYKRGTSQEETYVAKKDTIKIKPIVEIQPDQLWADLRDAKNKAIRNALNFSKNKVKTQN